MVFIAFLDYSIISPFIPPQAIRIGISISEISIIFSMYFIFGSIASVITGKIIVSCGRRNLFVLGATLQAVAII